MKPLSVVESWRTWMILLSPAPFTTAFDGPVIVTPGRVVTTSCRYVPAARWTTAPVGASSSAFWIVASGAPVDVPAAESLPDGET